MNVKAKVKGNWKEQIEFIKSDHPHPALVAGLGFGKTNAIPKRFSRLWSEAIKNGVKDPVLFNVTLKSSLNKSVIIPEFKKFLHQYGIEHRFRGSNDEQYFQFMFNGNEVKIYLYSAQKPEDIVSINSIGGNIDEFDVVKANKQQELWDKCLGRCRVGSNPSLSITTTAEGYKYAHYLCVRSAFETFEGDKIPEREPIAQYIRAETASNKTLSPNYIPNLKRSLDPLKFEAYTTGRFINFASGRVFKWWNDAYIAELGDPRGLYGSHVTFWDFGVVNPTYVGFAIVDDDDIYVYDEVMVKRELIDDIIENMVLPIRHPLTIADYCDPAGSAADGTTLYGETDVMMSKGLRPRWRGSEIADRIFIINLLMSKGKIKVNPKCKHLISTFENSVYPEPVNGIYDERPIKDGKYDHARDAFGYFMINHFEHKLRYRK